MSQPIRYVVIDVESYYCSKSKYSLRNMTTQAYIRDERFRVHGVGIKVGNRPARWVTHQHVKRALELALAGRTVMICHNAAFDASIVEWIYGIRPWMIIDTISLARAMLGASAERYSLDYLGKLLFDQGKTDDGRALRAADGLRFLPPHLEATMATYCMGDCDLTWELFKRCWRGFPKAEALMVDWCARAFCEPMLELDVEMLRANAERIEAEHESLVEELGLESSTEVVSNAQFAEKLKALGVEPPRKLSPTTGLSTWAFSKTDLPFLALQQHPDPKVAKLVAGRLKLKQSMEKTRSWSYAAAGEYGAWPIDLRYSGAVTTHRLSGGMGGGGNPQNMTRGGVLRNAIMAPEGYMIVPIDQSQIELRITMALAGEDEAIEILRTGGDLYCSFGSDIYRRPITKADKLERQIAKSAVLGLGFGMGVQRFKEYVGQQGIALTDRQAADIVYLYRRKFAQVPALWERAEQLLTAMFEGRMITFPYKPLCFTGYDVTMGAPCIYLPGGLTIKYPDLRRTSDGWMYGSGRNKTNLFGGKVVENIVQAIARQTAVEKLIKINQRYRVVMMVHDEIVALVRDEEVEEAKAFMTACVNQSPEWWPELPVASEIGAGRRYGEAK